MLQLVFVLLFYLVLEIINANSQTHWNVCCPALLFVVFSWFARHSVSCARFILIWSVPCVAILSCPTLVVFMSFSFVYLLNLTVRIYFNFVQFFSKNFCSVCWHKWMGVLQGGQLQLQTKIAMLCVYFNVKQYLQVKIDRFDCHSIRSLTVNERTDFMYVFVSVWACNQYYPHSFLIFLVVLLFNFLLLLRMLFAIS